MRNLHKLYYKDYFSGVDFANLDSDKSKRAVLMANRNLTDKVTVKDLIVPDLGGDIDSIELEVLYPGLITGVGIQHEASVEGEFKLGLHLDYTTGLPLVYGSTVKGVLRSYFEEVYVGNNVSSVIADIFEGIGPDGNPKSIYARDIFYDAVISSANDDRLILCGDSLAPHGGTDHTDPFAEPVPISFVKIAPGVKILFRFRLCPTLDTAGNVIMSVEEKKMLFIQILTVFGIGAKTNVGYGQLKATREMELRVRVQRGNDLLHQADLAFEAGDYAKATEFYAQAGDCFAANTDEYRRCGSRIKEIRGVRFDVHISKGEVLMEQGELDQACREFEAAKEYAEGICEFNEERQAVYEARISTIEMKRLQQAAAQSQHAASTFAEHIAKASNIKMLIDRTKKWHKDGKAVEPQALADKVEALRQSVKPRELANFEKMCAELSKIAGL